MKITTAIALLCRFYGFALSEVMNFTLRQFRILIDELAEIMKFENPSSTEPARLSSASQHKLAMRMFGGKK